ncbi:hypothetical protein CSA80_00105 [Candidatus Saccharibacteria bacterium]|nr:MAG: hypothetical protein CSA80_00105 [Candidatus Saccharibacteria bacterium]
MKQAVHDEVALARCMKDNIGTVADGSSVITRRADVRRIAKSTVSLAKKKQQVLCPETAATLAPHNPTLAMISGAKNSKIYQLGANSLDGWRLAAGLAYQRICIN